MWALYSQDLPHTYRNIIMGFEVSYLEEAYTLILLHKACSMHLQSAMQWTTVIQLLNINTWILI